MARATRLCGVGHGFKSRTDSLKFEVQQGLLHFERGNMKGKSNISKILRKSNMVLKQSAPTILTCISAIGVVATAVMAVKETPKAIELIKNDSRINHDGDPYKYTKLEAIQSSWRCYIPATVIGLSTITIMFGTNVLNKRNQASLTSAYAMLNESYKRYRKSAIAVYGDDADDLISAQTAKSYVSSDGNYLYDPDLDDGNTLLFYDDCSNRYFRSTMASVLNAQYHVNRNLALRGYICLNEFYSFLGIEQVRGGDSIGWNFDELIEGGLLWLDFTNRVTTMDDGLECYIVTVSIEPFVFDAEDL